MRKHVYLWLLMCLAVSPSPAQEQSNPKLRQEYISPDKAVVVTVETTKTHESRLEFHGNSGKLLAHVDYSSQDGEHGQGVAKASWTPDSQFFVYSLENTGGHQPWHSPVQYFSRRHDNILSLDEALKDAVTNPNFTVSAPDKVTVELYITKRKMTVALSSINASD
jgi:hypothetical protein